ncbi:MOSC domain-containing protein [Longispora fulva]|uniref:MOSC domain-containing protein YiiM n=1 Tax=Longispora fulva TaxID=619741 RepID=A0A8J7GJP8_9ACTN|nr:MOSC domain-containing protein [Longispora fulva]MBG6141663.1 MOSC domain-containing protein YiiM [Longispora fulva]
MASVLSLNIGRITPTEHATPGETGIDKRPVPGPVAVTAPGPKGVGGSGLAGDRIRDLRHHGGDDQAVYAYAAEDLDAWAAELGRELRPGMFGENLTTVGLDVTGALIGERWRVGPQVVLEVTTARIPCRTFAGWLGEKRWVRRFTERGVPGSYLRVIVPGEIRAGDGIEVLHRPDHDVTVGVAFRALTTDRDLLPRLLAARALHPEALAQAEKGEPIVLDGP